MLLDTTSKLCRQISYSLNFRKRTFKTLPIVKHHRALEESKGGVGIEFEESGESEQIIPENECYQINCE